MYVFFFFFFKCRVQKSGLCGICLFFFCLFSFFLKFFPTPLFFVPVLCLLFLKAPDGHTVSRVGSIYLGTAMKDNVYMQILSPYLPISCFYFYFFFCQSLCLFSSGGVGGRAANLPSNIQPNFLFFF